MSVQEASAGREERNLWPLSSSPPLSLSPLSTRLVLIQFRQAEGLQLGRRRRARRGRPAHEAGGRAGRARDDAGDGRGRGCRWGRRAARGCPVEGGAGGGGGRGRGVVIVIRLAGGWGGVPEVRGGRSETRERGRQRPRGVAGTRGNTHKKKRAKHSPASTHPKKLVRQERAARAGRPLAEGRARGVVPRAWRRRRACICAGGQGRVERKITRPFFFFFFFFFSTSLSLQHDTPPPISPPKPPPPATPPWPSPAAAASTGGAPAQTGPQTGRAPSPSAPGTPTAWGAH